MSNCFYKNHRSHDFRLSIYLSNLLFLCSNTTTDSQNKNPLPAVFFGKVSMFGYIRLRFQPNLFLRPSANHPQGEIDLIAFIQIILQVIPVIFAIPVLNKVFTIMVLEEIHNFIC